MSERLFSIITLNYVLPAVGRRIDDVSVFFGIYTKSIHSIENDETISVCDSWLGQITYSL